MQHGGWLHDLRQVRDQQLEWVRWWQKVLPPELAQALVNVVQKKGELTLLAISPAWSARLRYAIEDLMPQLLEQKPGIVSVRVRVAPSGQKKPTA